MIRKKGKHLTKNLGNTRRKERWSRGRRELSHHSSEITFRKKQLLKNPK
jgi:hypothetical protein